MAAVVWMNREKTLRVVRDPVVERDLDCAAQIDAVPYAVEYAGPRRDATGAPVWELVTRDSAPGAAALLGLVRLAIESASRKEG